MQIVAEKRSIGHGLESMFSDWSDPDPVGASRLIAALPRCNFKTSAALKLSLRWGETDPVAALQFARELEPVVRDRAEEQVVKSWLLRDLENAKSYAETMGAAARARVGKPLAGTLAQTDPVAAMNWVDQFLTGKPRTEAIEQVIRRGTAKHPEQVAAIVTELPPGELKADALAHVAKTWFRRDADTALAWADGLPEGYEKETAASAILAAAKKRQ